MLEQNNRVSYPSDLSDAEWELINPHIPTPITNRGKKQVHSYREILNTIFYLLRSGCAASVTSRLSTMEHCLSLFPCLAD